MTRLLLAVGLAAGAALEFECSSDESSDGSSQRVVVYEQSEIGSVSVSGGATSGTTGFRVADDWPASARTQIQAVTWWIQLFPTESLGDANIRFYQDDNGFPGEIAYEATVAASDLVLTDLGQIDGFSLYRVIAELPSSYSPSEGTEWISIAGDGASYTWRSLLGDPPFTYRYNQLVQQDGPDEPWNRGEAAVYDMAFRLEGLVSD